MAASTGGPSSAYDSSTFERTLKIAVDDDTGAASISPAARDIVLASKHGLRIIDLDNPWSLPTFIPALSSWDVADVQWSPFACRSDWVATTRNQLAVVYNLSMPYNNKKPPIEYTLRAHDRAITDINFAAHNPDVLATCGVDSFVFVHDLRSGKAPLKLADFHAGATQVKWNRRDDKIIASAHDKYLHIWDIRKGATPLSTIAAHSTKIYGIDWNRNDAKKILTCSLDSTIKLWNNVGVTSEITTPRRIIRTHYPVWRARHTPFLNGILAMPQRGNSKLWLYKHVNDSKPEDFPTGPAHEFQAHEPESQVREFLWRTRGSTEDGIDHRDFQLVSWGTDKHLHLHRLSPELLEKMVGFRKGETPFEGPTRTRTGAIYHSYRDGPIPSTIAAAKNEYGSPRNQPRGNLATLLKSHSRNNETKTSKNRNDTAQSAQVELLQRETMTAQRIRRPDPRVVTHITWMEGVKFGDRHADGNETRPRSSQRGQNEKHPFQEQNDLGVEISSVGNKYRKLTFEKIDVPGRCMTVSFNGPWGDHDTTTDDARLVFLRLTIRFPPGYPKAVEAPSEDEVLKVLNPLEIEFEKTTASISRETQIELIDNMEKIALTCADQQREALEAVLSYAIGERGLDDSLHLAGDDQSSDNLDALGAESSSDDDEHGEDFVNEAMQSSLTNANVPTPIQCTVSFSVNGSLIIARVPPSKLSQGLEGLNLRIARNLRRGPVKDDIFDSFGLFAQPAEESDDDSSPSSSVGTWDASSSPSSAASDHVGDAHVGDFQPPLAWQKAAARFSRNSLPSSSGAGRALPKTKSTVSILFSSVEDLIPSKRVLAEEYRIFGPGPEICQHNSDVARNHGYEDLANVWLLCKLILNNEVPLEILPQTLRKDQILVLARRALVRIKRKDSGLDLQFDEADTVTNPKLKGRIKWGNHIVVSWLIPALFDHFERLADTQMLAMLSCIFAEPAAREGVTSAIAKTKPSHLPMSMEAPAFSLDYFSSAEAAWSLFKPTISIPSTPSYSRFATPVNEFGWQKLAKTMGTYGSHGSSNGPWSSDVIISEPVTPYSTGNTPPICSRASTIRTTNTATHTPYSTSPEQSYTAAKKSSTANFASALTALSRPFQNVHQNVQNAISASPPVKSRIEDLSTSAPTSGVTWGATTFYDNDARDHDRRSLAPSRSRHTKRPSFEQSQRLDIDYLYDSDSDYDRFDENSVTFDSVSENVIPSSGAGSEVKPGVNPIRISFKNQDQFDDEACVSKPLLDLSKDWLYRAWREQYAEMLGCWGLVCERAEILKFNGLVSYFPVENSRNGSRAGSMYLSLKKGGDGLETGSRHFSRASSTLVPPFLPGGQLRRSPLASPKLFSFNPEAQEFQPGGLNPSSMPDGEEFQAPADITNTNEQYLRLSIPAPTPTREYDESVAGLGTSPGHRLHPHTRLNRPSLSRGTSNISYTSSWGGTRSAATKANANEPIYSCSICWIRVSGRFYLCPACGHVAHFDCMDDELGTDDADCVVGCGCGCGQGVEDDDKRSRMEAYLDGVRAAQAAGIAWDVSDDWIPSGANSQPLTPGMLPEGIDFMTGGMSKMAVMDNHAKQKKERSAGATSPTPTVTKRKEKGKKKKKAIVSGLSYY